MRLDEWKRQLAGSSCFVAGSGCLLLQVVAGCCRLRDGCWLMLLLRLSLSLLLAASGAGAGAAATRVSL